MSDRRPVVAVAMSGGVDSSVAAALCVEAGYDVFGIMLRLWAEPGARSANACCTLEAMDDAHAVAAALDIPFSVIEATDVFERQVVQPFVDDSVAGETPNPCLRCNRYVRFSYLLDKARALGAEYLTTGHYAQLDRDADGRCRLLRGADRSRDQSYVLHVLDQAQLRHAMFPVGGLLKSEVRDHARRLGLPVAERAESTDLCWVGDDGVAGFLKRRFETMTAGSTLGGSSGPSVGPSVNPGPPALPGPIVDRDGRVLGEHQGLPLYTLGQRRGLGVATGAPVYVVERDLARNTLVVGSVDELFVARVQVRAFHWISGDTPEMPLPVEAQIRYKAAPAGATLTAEGGAVAVEGGAVAADGGAVAADGGAVAVDGGAVTVNGGAATANSGAVTVVFDEPQRAPTPGQALVVYQGDECLGGGLIANATD